MAKQPKIKLAIEKWLKDNPDYKGTVKEMAKQISKKTGYSQTSIRNAYYKGGFKNKPVAQNENNEDKPEVEEIVFKVDSSHITISDKANLLEREILNCLWEMIQKDGVVKVLPGDLICQILGVFNFYQIKPLSYKWTVKRALRKQVGIVYKFYSGILIATSIYGGENENQPTKR